MNENHSLVEVKLNDAACDAPKDQLYKWLSISTATSEVKQLKFESMGTELVNGNEMNIRIFTNAELRFDKSFGKFVVEGEGHILMNCSQQSLPEELSLIIDKFLESLT